MNLDAIATEVETLRQRLPAVEQAHTDAQQAAEEADSRRVRLAYAVHVEHRDDQTADLERAAAAYDDAKRKVHDTEIALDTLRGRFGELDEARKEAERQAVEDELAKVSGKMVNSGKDLDKALAAAGAALREYVALTYRALNLRRKCGLGMSLTPKAAATTMVIHHFVGTLAPVMERSRVRHPDLTGFENFGRLMGKGVTNEPITNVS